MISPLLIVISAVVTAVAVGAVTRRSRWPWRASVAAGVGSLLAVVVWRLLSNVWGLNSDFAPLVSPGDVGCLVAGAVGPAALAAAGRRTRWVFPVVAGGLVAFIVNVVIL